MRIRSKIAAAARHSGRVYLLGPGREYDYLPPGLAAALVRSGQADEVKADEPSETPVHEPAENKATGPTEAPAVEPQEAPEGSPEANKAPSRYEAKAAWVDYAVSRGVDRGVAEEMTKAELVDQFGG